jgi:hypothetical protein
MGDMKEECCDTTLLLSELQHQQQSNRSSGMVAEE